AFDIRALDDLFPSYIFDIAACDSGDALPLTDDQRAAFDASKNVNVFDGSALSGSFFAVARIHGGYAVIDSDVGTLFDKIKTASYIVSLLSFIIGAVVILIGGRHVVRPILKLDRAAKKVAAGDLSVRIDDKRCGKDEIGSLINSFNRMMEELGEVEILRNGFISDVSHEFKIPLTTISGYAKLLQDGCDAGEQAEYTQVIIEESRHLSTLVDNILILNRLEKNEGEAETEEIAVAEQVRRALTLYEPMWTEKNIALTFDLEEITVRGYGVLLMQVWSNLIDNAIKFTPESGRVAIRLYHENRGIIFSIQDTGSGIDADQQQRIFDKFYKAAHARNTEGNGLGLAIVKRIVEIHGGTVTVASIPGGATTFTVLLDGVPGA
ncbi:MAG: HAMP domain-containing histidine kinase, partial [Oscillospiraceae bacterium]|nr:HAMP domain-containing histidine kinase [Oscillospiraceae bacterium]